MAPGQSTLSFARLPARHCSGQIAEIDASPALRLYGIALALTHLFTWYFWTATKDLPSLFAQGPRDAICWPYFEDCWRLRPLSKVWVHWTLSAYGVLAALTVLLWLRRRWLRPAYALLLAINLLKFALFSLDYRLMGNYHYMPFVLSAAFLFWPHKELLLRYLLVGFYLSAGSLKLNLEWLSGAALLRPAWLTGWLGDLSLAYVVLLELLLVLGVLSKHPIVFFATLAQLVLFHAYSWHIVGYFYPCIMFCLLSLFPLCRFLGVATERSLGALLLERRLPRSIWVALGVFTAAQAAPAFFPGDVALTGEGRIFALDMLDASSQCSLLLITKEGNLHTERSALRAGLGVRTHCDPLVYFNTARGLCAQLEPGDDLDLALVSRRTTGQLYQQVFSVQQFCSKRLSFHLWRHNSWMDP